MAFCVCVAQSKKRITRCVCYMMGWEYENNIRFIWLLFKVKLQRQMMYPISFFGVTLVDGSLFLLWLLMFETIYSQVDSIGGWSRGQTIIFLGTFSLLNAINATIYFFGVLGIPKKFKMENHSNTDTHTLGILANDAIIHWNRGGIYDFCTMVLAFRIETIQKCKQLIFIKYVATRVQSSSDEPFRQ